MLVSYTREWFRHIKRREETEKITAVIDMKMEGKRSRGRPKLQWKDTVRRDMKAWNITFREEWAGDRETWKGPGIWLARPSTLHRETAAKVEK